jgi:hypothetical protein
MLLTYKPTIYTDVSPAVLKIFTATLEIRGDCGIVPAIRLFLEVRDLVLQQRLLKAWK